MSSWRQLSLLKGVRQKGELPPLPKERDMHIGVAKALKYKSPGWLANHFPSGEKRTKQTGALLKAMGHVPGWSDFILIDPKGQHYWLELKRGKAPLSPDQQDFAVALLERGTPWAVVRSEAEAIAKLREWGAIRLRITA